KDTAISSVVPGKTEYYRNFIDSITGSKTMIVSHKLRLKLRLGYRRPSELGTDRIAAMVGGRARYNCDLIIVNFGTATTLDVVLKSGYFPGGIITTGIQTGINVLADNTAQLLRFKPQWPVALLGRSTRDCLRCGALLGTKAMIKGLIGMIGKKYNREFLSIATGGWAKRINDNASIFDRYDPDLILYGIYRIFQYNDNNK
ncbi:hypothetical protein A2Y85_01535, partial [candidate division WOR-3 bacterium RBG_13_43_14]